MAYQEDARSLEQRLTETSGVRYAALQWPAPGHLEVGVVLESYDLDVRARVIELIDDFHREHVHEVNVDFDIVDVEHGSQA